MTVFYVDDDQDDLDLFKEALMEINSAIKLVTFTNGPDAIRELKSEKSLPDYIFLDINVSPLNGKQCLDIIKQDAQLKKIPVYILSTANNPTEVLECFKLGSQDYIRKEESYTKFRVKLKSLFAPKGSGNLGTVTS